jgi:DNA polymerase III alpha subunit
MELETLGLTASMNPSELLAEAAREAGAVSTTDLVDHAGKRVRVAGFVVTDRRVRTGKGGRWMKFLMLEDLHGTVEVVLFPSAYARLGHLLTNAGPFLVTGIVRNAHGALTLDAREIERLKT